MALPSRWPPPFDPDVPLRKSLDPGEWSQVVREIARRHGWGGEDLASFASGSDVVWGGRTIVIKLSRPRWAAEIEAEARALEFLEGRLSYPTPRLEARGEIAGWPYVVQSRIPGRALGTVWPDLDRSRRLRLADALGRTTAELHAAPGFPDDGSWAAFLEERRRRVEGHHRNLGAPGAWVERVGEFLRSVPLGEAEPVFLHTELLDEHVLVEEREGSWEIAGLLDFADSRVGDPHYEFAAPIEFIFRGEPGCLPSFLCGYGWGDGDLTPEAARRLAAWGLLHQFGSLPRVLEIAGKPEPRSFEELANRVYSLRTP